MYVNIRVHNSYDGFENVEQGAIFFIFHLLSSKRKFLTDDINLDIVGIVSRDMS